MPTAICAAAGLAMIGTASARKTGRRISNRRIGRSVLLLDETDYALALRLYLSSASLTVSFRLPMAFCTLPSVLSDLPSDCSLASPKCPASSFLDGTLDHFCRSGDAVLVHDIYSLTS